MEQLRILYKFRKIDDPAYDFWAEPNLIIETGFEFVYRSARFKITAVSDPGASNLVVNGIHLKGTHFVAERDTRTDSDLLVNS